ncbi:MepB family protein [Paenarthrobacter sp. A20]|uniref:MepB family protein n=1 Tax=Paenarthrobacter sp. A20 TaxID=2817891 RepID=UPI0020A08A2F|nr:MepB family protein [Paenarthrobacter sp. A20]MCP1411545.1 hypothetical protein [Paenarthrobacter sp. A20]
MHTERMIHPDVAEAQQLMHMLGRECSLPVPEEDNAEYGAATATSGTALIRFRVGKLTPTKVGLFVAVWRRSAAGGTEPFPADGPSADPGDTLVVSAREAENSGHFVFPLSALVDHGIGSVDGIGGKRGFRVYPPWSLTSNRQARKTQGWQSEYFHASVEDGLPAR